MLLTRAPLCIATALDLHVLGLPPAFVLSQDQTLKLILKLCRTRCSSKTEVFDVPPHGGRNAFLLLSRQRNASLNRAQSSLPGFTSGVAIEPPPTSPFLKSQCQRAAPRREQSVCQRRNTARKAFASRAVWARYIGGCGGPVKPDSVDISAFFLSWRRGAAQWPREPSASTYRGATCTRSMAKDRTLKAATKTLFESTH